LNKSISRNDIRGSKITIKGELCMTDDIVVRNYHLKSDV